MFKRKKCMHCNKKFDDSYSFCPYCGRPQVTNSEGDFGLLGKTDSIENIDLGLPRGLNMIFKSLVKNLDSQFKNLEKEMNKSGNNNFKPQGISINISTSGKMPPMMNYNQNNPQNKSQKAKTKPLKKVMKTFSKTSIAKMAKLKKIEPETKVRRLSDTVIYEINIPTVKSLNDISIIQLEDSIEVKAAGKSKGYVKIIPINLPILSYELENEVLKIEFQSQ